MGAGLSIFQTGRQSFRDSKSLAQGHTARKCRAESRALALSAMLHIFKSYFLLG